MKQNYTCESASPLLDYTGAWVPQVGDVPGSSNASSSVRMVSKSNGDSVSFNFTGTGIWIYPATNTPHGSYDVFLDGTPQRFEPSTGPTDVNAPLFQASNLQAIPHVLSIHNTEASGSSYLDLAFVTWEERDKYGNATSISTQGDEDDSSSMSWHPFDMWMSETEVVAPGPNAGVGAPSISLIVHTANYSGAWMQYNFSANTVSIYGNVGPKQGPYSVLLQYVLDNGVTADDADSSYELPDEMFFNASFPVNRTKVLLFHATNINASRTTTLKLTNHPDKQGDSVSIDYSVLARYVTSISSDGVQSSFPVPAMVGSIIGALLMLGLVLVALYFLRRRRKVKLIRQQKTNVFRDLLARRGVLSPESNDMKKGTPRNSTQERDNDATK